MAYKRKTEIPPHQLELIKKIGAKLKTLRENDAKLSIERFCSRNEIPRITYGNIESGKGSFQITTLITILESYEMDLKSFFEEL